MAKFIENTNTLLADYDIKLNFNILNLSCLRERMTLCDTHFRTKSRNKETTKLSNTVQK